MTMKYEKGMLVRGVREGKIYYIKNDYHLLHLQRRLRLTITDGHDSFYPYIDKMQGNLEIAHPMVRYDFTRSPIGDLWPVKWHDNSDRCWYNPKIDKLQFAPVTVTEELKEKINKEVHADNMRLIDAVCEDLWSKCKCERCGTCNTVEPHFKNPCTKCGYPNLKNIDELDGCTRLKSLVSDGVITFEMAMEIREECK